MNYCVITFRSVTPAQRGERAVRAAGIPCSIQRTPRWMEDRGCGYSLRVRCEKVSEAAEVLRQKGIRYQSVYHYRDKDHVEEMEL